MSILPLNSGFIQKRRCYIVVPTAPTASLILHSLYMETFGFVRITHLENRGRLAMCSQFLVPSGSSEAAYIYPHYYYDLPMMAQLLEVFQQRK